MEFEYKEEYYYFKNACLNVTDACNLACKYCFVQQKPHYMSLDIAKKCVDFLANNIKKSNKQNGSLTFFGGEPTLLWDEIIVPITEYIEDNYPNLIYLNITTNGTLLNKDRIDFMYSHNIKPHLSCDGDEFVQNENRPCRDETKKSFDLVIKNIPYLLYRFPQTTMRATISQDTVDQTFNSYLFANLNNFQSFFITPNCREKWSEENLKILNEQVQLIYSYILTSFIENKKPINFSSINKTFTQILQRDLQVYNKEFNHISVERSPYRCGLGTTSAAFGYDGKIYGCQEQNSYENNSLFYIGDIFNGIDKNKHYQLLKKYTSQAMQKCENQEECNNCPLRYTCQDSCCPSVNLDIFNDMFCHSIVDCRWQKMLFFNAIPIMNILVLNDNQMFKNYLDNDCQYLQYSKKEEQ